MTTKNRPFKAIIWLLFAVAVFAGIIFLALVTYDQQQVDRNPHHAQLAAAVSAIATVLLLACFAIRWVWSIGTHLRREHKREMDIYERGGRDG